jgi:hypothetical protein
MQRNLVSLLLITATITGVVSCSRSDKGGIAVPKDATMVVHINTPSITSKVNWQEIKENDWFKELYNDNGTDSFAKKLMDDPSNSGIDLKADMVFFMKQQGQGGYAAFEGSVSNATAFEAFNKEINKGGTVSKQGDINVLKTGLTSVLLWNDKRFVYVMDSPGPFNEPKFDSSGNFQPPSKFSVDSLQKFGVQLFDLEKKNSLLSDDRFADMIKEPGDIHFWSNAGQYLQGMAGVFGMMRGLSDLIEGNVSASSLNFENGKIAMTTKTYYNKKLGELFDKYPPGKISADVINRIPSQNVVAVFAVKYPPAGLKDIIKLVGVDGLVNSFLGENGYSVDEFIKANKGDLLLAFSDFQFSQREITIPNPDGEPYTMKSSAPDFKVLFATSVNDKAAFDKLIGLVKAKVPENVLSMAKVSYQLNDQWFAASNSPEHINGFLTGGNTKQPFASRISGKAFGGYVNVQQILQSSRSAISDSSGLAAMDASIKMWQDIVMSSGDKKGNAITGEIEINLVDKSTNSLKQLNNYVNTLAKIFKQKKSEYNVRAHDAFIPKWASY